MSDMCEDNINEVSATAQEVNTPEVKTLNVNVNLLNNIRTLLEISTQRGTFKANELSSVGKVYDELLVLLK
jgi:hypothetical protein